MPNQFGYGAVLSWKNFQFDDGGTSNKLLVVLGAKQGQDVISVLATSQQHHHKANPGCHMPDGYFFIPAGTGGFPKDTWLELNRPVEMSNAEVLKASMANDLNVVSNLPQQLANEIRNCLKQSSDITPHQERLLQ